MIALLKSDDPRTEHGRCDHDSGVALRQQLVQLCHQHLDSFATLHALIQEEDRSQLDLKAFELYFTGCNALSFLLKQRNEALPEAFFTQAQEGLKTLFSRFEDTAASDENIGILKRILNLDIMKRSSADSLAVTFLNFSGKDENPQAEFQKD